MLVVAHRGALHEAQENSFAAFDAALDAGADRIELDVHLSLDGTPWIMHDDHTLRSTGQNLSITNSRDNILRGLKLRDGSAVPTLDEVMLRYSSRIELNIEIKGRSSELARVVGASIKKHHATDRVVVSCFRPEPLLWMRSNFRAVRLACLIGEKTNWPKIDEQHPLLFMNQIGAKILHPWAPLVNERLMDQARAREWIVIPYTSAKGEEDSDRESLWTYLRTLGVDGLCTNYPRELRSWLGF